jgi:hypothetical protein
MAQSCQLETNDRSMGDARLGVNPDAAPENKKLRWGGAFPMSD